MATQSGLEDQMLSIVIQIDYPEKELLRNDGITKNAEMKKEMKLIENKILQLLQDSGEDILDDEQLINALMESKDTNAIITEKLKDLEKINEDIEKTTEK
jgi:dynein heavy chain